MGAAAVAAEVAFVLKPEKAADFGLCSVELDAFLVEEVPAAAVVAGYSKGFQNPAEKRKETITIHIYTDRS